MDKTIPAGAAMLLNFIYRADAGHAPPDCYRTIFGNRQKYLPKPLTSMTLGEVIDAQKDWSNRAWVRKNWSAGAKAASSAAGAAQFMRDTLIGLAKEFHISGMQSFDPDFQDRMAFKLLLRRGYNDFMAGKISRAEFGKRLAQEWASFPVLAACQGAHGKLRRGQSYYDGDGVNSALVLPADVEAMLDRVKATKSAPQPAQEAPKPVPAPSEPPKAQPAPTPAPEPSTAKPAAAAGGLLLAIAAAATWWHDITSWIGSFF